jgi:phospholipid/cholesterol/gamma-HCH transport system substrate-binding protein
VVTGLLTLYIGQQILGADPFADRYKLTARFNDVNGLLSGDLVKVAGAPVGRVGSVKVKSGLAEVVMEVDKKVKIPDDSTAAIRWRNLVGQRMVYLEPGASHTMLGPGARVPHTRDVVDLGEIVNSVGPLTRSLDPGQINKILTAFSQTLDGNEGNINLLIDNVDGLLKTFSARKQAIESLVRDYKTVTDAVAIRDRQISASVDNLAQLTDVFAKNSKLLDSAIVEVAGVTTNLNQVLGGNDDQLARIIQNLAKFTETARIKINDLEKMVQNLPVTLRQLFAAGNGGHFLRTNALCLNIRQGPCPFPMRFPRGTTQNKGPSAGDLALLEAMLTGGAR